MIIGASNTGKSTFARYLYHQLVESRQADIAFLDGDPGQASLGPPTTLTIAAGAIETPRWLKRWFVGATTPRKHMLPMLVGAARLLQAAHHVGCQTVIYDTCGLINPADGGLALKRSLIDLLQPSTVIAIQAENELAPLLLPLQKNKTIRLVKLHPAPQARNRSPLERRSHRAEQFQAYFSNAKAIEISWNDLAVFPWPRFSINCLLSLEDKDGFSLALGILLDIDRKANRLSIYTPPVPLEDIAAIRLGDLSLDPHTFTESWNAGY